MNHEHRILKNPGLINVRDLGGMPVEGSAETKFGRIFRGPNLDHIDESSVDFLVQDRGVNRLIDIRAEIEGLDDRSSPIARKVADRYQIPLIDDAIVTSIRAIDEWDPVQDYSGYVDRTRAV